MKGLRICIDRGGTFTDCIAFAPGRKEPIVLKLLSVDSKNYPDAPREGIRRILEHALGKRIPRDELLDASAIEWIRMGTTVATNALLERQGTKCALVVTKGFRDLLYIGNQSRPDIFDLSVSCPQVLYDHVIEVDERVTLVAYSASSKGKNPVVSLDASVVRGETGELVQVLKEPNASEVERDLQTIFDMGYRSVAVCLLHSFTFRKHERLVAEIAAKVGFQQVSVSSEIMPMVKYVPRATSSVVDAYLTPCIQAYVSTFYAGFQSNLKNVKIEFMQSDGGLAPVNEFYGFKAILSGPAGGVVGHSMTTYCDDVPVIGFDMGGTSTDVSRYSGEYEHLFESQIAGATLQAPQLDINTVAAGGGSRLFYKNGMFVVGPDSVGAEPGPVCYKKGGFLAVTDANLVLGRLYPKQFPAIFGPNENEPLDANTSRAAFEELALNASFPKPIEDMALGFVKVANEAMCRPIRSLTQSKGHEPSAHVLSVFGGAGGQHACAIARQLGIRRVFLHKHASLLSAYGLGLASAVEETQVPCSTFLTADGWSQVLRTFERLADDTRRKLLDRGFDEGDPDVLFRLENYLHLRYEGTDCALMVCCDTPNCSIESFKQRFLQKYASEFGFTLASDRPIVIDDVRVRGSFSAREDSKPTWMVELATITSRDPGKLPPAIDATHQVYFDQIGWRTTPVYLLDTLPLHSRVEGPALLVGSNESILVEPRCTAGITASGVGIEVESKLKSAIGQKNNVDPVMLGIFSHRFMSIAENMGRTLQKTAISTNIKERLDFSCALFGPAGGLVAHAPHLPVHLGSMQDAVEQQLSLNRGQIAEGDVFVTNHPQCGGSHLPDITVVTPVFHNGNIVFAVASRGHHADIGGSEPGSMPPRSTELYEEGAQIRSFKLLKRGVFDEIGITRILADEPAKFPNCQGTRCLQDNLSDLRAQVAANQRGISLVKQLIDEYSLETVQAYMEYIRQAAAAAVRELLMRTAAKLGNELKACDQLDDGTTIRLTVKLHPQDGTAHFDFSGTDPQVYGNTNAPPSVTKSAIIYCLRSLIAEDIPLNQGCLEPVSIHLPPNSVLSPSEEAAVVGGNVLTSQRLCDVILKAFNACAASQGCCNNFTFGMDTEPLDGDGGLGTGFGYYETIAGGAGAGPTWIGRSGVHTHMTNTRITDPEIFERRYPAILREFSLRDGSGGDGLHRGGDGVVREIEFTESLKVSVLTERRVFQPYGLCGGMPGKRGNNYLLKKDKEKSTYRKLNLGGKNCCTVDREDIIRIETPGGGGYGTLGGEVNSKVKEVKVPVRLSSGSVSDYVSSQHAN